MVKEILQDRVQQALDSVAEKKTDRLQRQGTRPANTIKKKREKSRTSANAPKGDIMSDDLEIEQSRVPSFASS